MSFEVEYSGSLYGRYSFNHMNRRTKTEFAGISIGDAYRHNLDYHVRLHAQRMFYSLVNKVQQVAIRLVKGNQRGLKKLVKPQISPFYTNYPSTLSAYASIGWTAFLEVLANNEENSLAVSLKDYLDNPGDVDSKFVDIDQQAYKELAAMVADTVQNRVLLEELSRQENLSFIEMYRLFAAAQQDFSYGDVKQILDAVILYGDILPDWQKMNVHPVTAQILKVTLTASRRFFDSLPSTRNSHLLELGRNWVRALCITLSVFLPVREETGKDNAEKKNGEISVWEELLLKQMLRDGEIRLGNLENPEEKIPEVLPPLDKPQVPTLRRSRDVKGRMENSLEAKSREQRRSFDNDGKGGSETVSIQNRLKRFSEVLAKATKQKKGWEDIPFDQVEKTMQATSFKVGIIQETPVEGHEIKVVFHDHTVAYGEIHDRPVVLSPDVEALNRLLLDSADMTRKLKKALYPNLQQQFRVETLCTSGVMNPSRLACGDFSEAIFKRYQVYESPDKKGKSLLVIAADGSGSLNEGQMKMLKILCAAWLNSTVNSGIQIMAGLYHSGQVKPGISGPLVQWIYHPQKTPSIGRHDAVSSLVSLPDTGTGVQSDALSIRFIINEAVNVARGRMIYLVLLTDCKWNRSFENSKGGLLEVVTVLNGIRSDLAHRLHVTIIGLGNEVQSGIEKCVDKTVSIPDSEIRDAKKVAEKIALYVVACMNERKRVRDRRKEV